MGQILNDVQNFFDHFRIQRRGRLVEQHHVGLHGQAAGYRNPLLLAAGKLGWIGIPLIRQAHAPEQPDCRFFGLLAALSQHLSRGNGDVIHHRQMGKKIKVLEYHPHPLPHAENIDGRVVDLLAVDDDIAASGRLQ